MLDVPRSAAGVLRLVAAGLIVTSIGVSAIAAIDRARHHIHLRIPDYVEFSAFVLLFAMLYYLAFSKTGAGLSNRLGDLMGRVIRWF